MKILPDNALIDKLRLNCLFILGHFASTKTLPFQINFVIWSDLDDKAVRYGSLAKLSKKEIYWKAIG